MLDLSKFKGITNVSTVLLNRAEQVYKEGRLFDSAHYITEACCNLRKSQGHTEKVLNLFEIAGELKEEVCRRFREKEEKENENSLL